jgi:hypothetical protein
MLERLWTFLLVWSATKLGYNICLYRPMPESDEVRVLHLYATEWDLRRSCAAYLEEA